MLDLDFETFSELDIKKVGGYAYAMHPSTEVLMASYAIDHGEIKLWDATVDPMPEDLRYYLEETDGPIGAFNANFERLIFWYVLHMPIALERFQCTMVHAWSLSFSGTLAEVGEQMGLSPDRQKLATGSRLIQRFCKPAPKNHKARRYDRHSHPEEWELFKEYCIQDTMAEREIKLLLQPYPIPEQEREYWLMDQRINDRGLPISEELVQGAIKIARQEIKHLQDKMIAITGLANPNSVQQLQPWIESQGVWMPNLQKETVRDYLEKYALPENVKQVLQLRQQSSKSSIKKWEALARAIVHGHLHGAFQFAGAQRTQRWAGRIFQPQNLPRPSCKDPLTPEELSLLKWADATILRAVFENVMQFLSDTLRSSVTAPDGFLLDVADLASIESRVIGWISGCHRINEIFAAGRDTYKDFATVAFDIPYEEVTGDQRFYCKPPDLGCGYRLGGKGLVAYAAGMGVEIDEEEGHRLVGLWRETRPEVCEMWYWLDEAIMAVIQQGAQRQGYGVEIYRDRSFLFIKLPSGRAIAYYQPMVQDMIPPWEWEKKEEAEAIGETYIPKTKPTITYMGMDQTPGKARKWKRLQTHGGKLTENIVQAIARDILAWQMHWLESQPGAYPLIVGHVHDEMITLIPDDELKGDYLNYLEDAMSITPPWAPGLRLGAEGYIAKHYRKD